MSWNIAGIAKSVMQNCQESISESEDFADCIDSHLQNAYWSIFSRDPKNAQRIIDLVRKYIDKNLTGEAGINQPERRQS